MFGKDKHSTAFTECWTALPKMFYCNCLRRMKCPGDVISQLLKSFISLSYIFSIRSYKTFHCCNWYNNQISYCVLLFWPFTSYFVKLSFRFQCFQKLTTKFWSRSDWFKISKFLTWRWRKLKKSISLLLTIHTCV